MNGFTILPKVYYLLVILTDITSFLVSFVCWCFQNLSEITMDEEIRSGKTPILGNTKEPQGDIQVDPSIKAWGCPGWHPLFRLPTIGKLLGAIFFSSHDTSFAWSVVYYMSIFFFWFLVFHNHICCTHLLRGTHIYSWFVRIFFVLHLYLLS